jgi:ATP-dependent Clp endopeptidase proteolytic subunit ClpP
MTELEQAQLNKLHAEADEIRARMARSAVLAEQTDARATIRQRMMEVAEAKANLELVEERYTVRTCEIIAAKTERDEKLLLSQWQFQHVFNFVGHVGKDTIQPCMDRLNSWDVMDPGCDITIVFNSPGGSVIDGMALFDYIRFIRGKGHKVTCLALGYAASMAGILLQAASDGCRVMAKGSWLLIHEVAFSTSGKIGEIEDMYKFGERMKKQAADIFIERSGGKLTHAVLTENWTRKDWWLSPEEALALGLIDEVR